jgi:hypothetical protein
VSSHFEIVFFNYFNLSLVRNSSYYFENSCNALDDRPNLKRTVVVWIIRGTTLKWLLEKYVMSLCIEINCLKTEISAEYFVWQRTYMFPNNWKALKQINSKPLLRNLGYITAGLSFYLDTFALNSQLIGIV